MRVYGCVAYIEKLLLDVLKWEEKSSDRIVVYMSGGKVESDKWQKQSEAYYMKKDFEKQLDEMINEYQCNESTKNYIKSLVEVRLEEKSVNSIQNIRNIMSSIQTNPGFYQKLAIISSSYHLRRLVQTYYVELKYNPKSKLLTIGTDSQKYHNNTLDNFFQELVKQWKQHRSQRPFIAKMTWVGIEVLWYVLAKLRLQGLVAGMASNVVAGKKSTI